MLHNLFNPITLPRYEHVKKFRNTGNFSVDKYYKWPFRYFYRHKLRMILDLIGDKYYYNILDFGCGKAQIFVPELKKHANFVIPFDVEDVINPKWKFDLVVCSSSLEFCNLHSTLSTIHSILRHDGRLVIASPMKTKVTDLYFKLIKDNKFRHSHHTILRFLKKYFIVEKYNEWFGLYFSARCRAK